MQLLFCARTQNRCQHTCVILAKHFASVVIEVLTEILPLLIPRRLRALLQCFHFLSNPTSVAILKRLQN